MMINIELTERGPLTFCRLARTGSRGLECYADLRSPVLRRLTISNRDSKLLETSATQTKQSPPPTSNRDKIEGSTDPHTATEPAKAKRRSEPDCPIRRIPRDPKGG